MNKQAVRSFKPSFQTAMVAVALSVTACAAAEPIPDPEESTDHVTAPSPLEGLKAPEIVTERAWEWEAPEGTVVHSVRPIPAGVAVFVTDGVVALRGDTGEELWRYRRTGEPTSDANVTQGEESVAVSYEAGEGSSPDAMSHDIVLLDSLTGEITSEQNTDFTSLNSVPENISLLDPLPARLGLLTRDARVALGYGEDEQLAVRVFSLSRGEEVWSRTDIFEPNERGQEFRPGELAVSEDTLIVTGSFVDPVDRLSDLDHVQQHTAVIVALDAGGGGELWRVEHELNAPVTDRDINLSTYPGSGTIAAVMEGSGYFEQWFLDPRTGKSVAEDVFAPGDHGIASIHENGYITVETDSASGTETYSLLDLSGDPVESVTVEETGVRAPENFLLPMEAGVARLDVGATSEGWEPARVQVFDWQTAGESLVIDLGIDVHRDPRSEEGSRSRFSVQPPTDMTLAPGALVITEVTKETILGNSATESRRLVGLT